MLLRRCRTLVLAASLALGFCAPPEPPQQPPVDGRVKALADTYLNGWFDQNPDQITYYGVPGRRHDRLPENSLEAVRAWQRKEDVWLADARAIQPDAIRSPSLRATYAIVREALEGSIGTRACRYELWNV